MTLRKRTGFTLVELMIVVAIVGVLASVGYPMYQEELRKAGRAEGKAALLRTAQMQERWYTSNGTYTATLGALFSSTAPLSTAATISSNENPAVAGKYTISVAAAAGGLAQGYVLTATPTAPFVDTAGCANLLLTSTGDRTYSGPGPRERCW
jgi:type IV pilus assembly protein PilE